MPYERVTLSLDEHSNAALVDVAQQTGIAQSMIVRALILGYAANKPAPLPKIKTHGPSVERLLLVAKVGQAAL